MIQLKHKKDRKERSKSPKVIAAGKLDSNNKQFSLEMYQTAYKWIIKNKAFLTENGIAEKAEIFCILYSNHVVNQNIENDNIGFEPVSKSKYFEFIDSSSNETNVLKIINKKQKYDEEFLNAFYFYTNQISEESVNDAISNLLGIGNEKTNILIDFFYKYAEPENDSDKLHKIDVKTKLLEIIFGEFPAPVTSETSHPLIIDVIKKYNVTVISEEDSSNIIWNEISLKIRDMFNNNIAPSSWEMPVPTHVIENSQILSFKNSKEFLQNRQKIVTVKQLFLFVVAHSEIPFFIRTDNSLFKSFQNILLPLLDIPTVVFNVKKEKLHFQHLSTLTSLNDIYGHTYYQCSKEIKVSFQGKCVIDLLSLIQNDTSVKRNISTDVFLKLLNNTCKIGKKRELLEYYISRKINIRVLNEKVLTNTNCLSVVCGVTEELKTQLPMKTLSLNEYREEVNKNDAETDEKLEDYNILTTTEEPSEQLLDELFRIKKLKKVLHVFKQVSSNGNVQLLLIHSSKLVTSFRPHCTENIIKGDLELSEISKGSKVHIICNNAGMGKSTILKFIASKFPPEQWVIHIELRKHRSSIKNIRNVNELEEFLCKHEFPESGSDYNDFLKTLYKNRLKSGKLVWLIDDYELVDDPHLLNLFKEASRGGVEIWIATRPSLKMELENCFNMFSMELAEFSTSDQRLFFEKYFQHTLKTSANISAVMKAIENKRHLFEDSFIGICQQTMMFAVLFESGEKQLTEYCINDLYEEFVKLKINEYPEEERRFILRTISKLALTLFFTKGVLRTFCDCEELADDMVLFKFKYKKDFIITGFTDNNLPIFSHQTYAEFLVARWLAHTVKKQKERNTPVDVTNVVKMLYFNELTTIRLFFDNIMTKDLPLHSAIVNFDKKELEHILRENNSHLKDTDILGRSVLHIAASYGNRYEIQTTSAVNGLLNDVGQYPQVEKNGKDTVFTPVESAKSKTTVFTQILNRFQDDEEEIYRADNFLRLNVLEYALRTGSLEELDAILKNENISLGALTDDQKICLLYYCARYQFNRLLKKLDVNYLNRIKVHPNQMTLLHVAVDSKNIDAVVKFTRQIELRSWQVDNKRNTALHLACEQTEDNMVESLLNLGNIDSCFLNLKNSDGQSHLHCLAYRGHAKWISSIIDFSGLKIDSECNAGNTPFLASVINGHIDVAEKLLSRGANIKHKNKKGLTALHYSAAKGLYDCTSKLINWGSDVDCQDNFRMTPLMKASSWGRSDVAELLLQNKADPNKHNLYHWTSLHFAARRGYHKVLSVLLDKGAKVNSVDKKGNTPLMTACLYNMPDCIPVLLAHNADVDMKSKYDTTALTISQEKCLRLILKHMQKHVEQKHVEQKHVEKTVKASKK